MWLCACAWVSAAPRRSWPGCWGVCVFVCVLILYPAIPSGLVCVCGGYSCACTPLSSGLGVGARGLLRAARLFPATFWSGCPWSGGVRELPLVGFVPSSPHLFFFLSRLRGGAVVFSLVVSWLCGVRRCLSRSRDCWSPSPLALSLGLRPCFFFALLCSSGVCVGVSGMFFPPGPMLSAGCRWFWQGGLPLCFSGAPWVPPLVLSGWRVCPPLVEWNARLRGCVSVSCPPPFFFSGAGSACSSLGWCMHWSAFDVANWVAVGALDLLGLAPAPWVGWVMSWSWSCGLSCRARFWLCRLGSCARRFREALG